MKKPDSIEQNGKVISSALHPMTTPPAIVALSMIYISSFPPLKILATRRAATMLQNYESMVLTMARYLAAPISSALLKEAQ